MASNTGTAGFSFTGPADPNATPLGAGPDSLELFVSERGEPAGAQFTIDVDGTQIGAVQTTAANVLTGQEQRFDLQGNFAAGSDTVTINYLNANQSLLFVDSATLDGTTLPASSDLVLSNTGAASFTFTEPDLATPLSVASVGSGPDTLALDLSQRSEPAGAQFTVSVDGEQYGSVQTVTADTLAGQFQQLDVLGTFAPGVSHTVSLTYLNANNSLLLVDNATINGATIAGGSEVLSNNGSLGFNFSGPPVPAPTTLGSGPDALALAVSEGYDTANAQFAITVDGAQVGGVQTANAITGNAQSQVFDVLGSFSGAHTVSINLLNPASGSAGTSGAASSLSIGGATIDGTAIANSALTLTTATPESFNFTH